MKKKNTDIKFVIQKCFVKYNNIIYTINLNYKTTMKKELSYIIIKTLKQNQKRVFLYNIKFLNNIIVDAKESVEGVGVLVEIEKLLISNKYYNIEKLITPEELKNYNITGFDNKDNRKHFYLLNYNELISFNNSIYPVYMIHGKYNLNISNIINTYFIVKPIKKVITINNFNQLKSCNYNFHFNDLEFHLELLNAEKKLNYYLLLYKKNTNIIKTELMKIKQFLLNNNIKNKNLLKNTIININSTKNNKEYYLNISGFKIINNKFYLSSVNKIVNKIVKIKKIDNNFYLNNNKINLNLIDNCNITLHETIELAYKCNYIKLIYLDKLLKEL